MKLIRIQAVSKAIFDATLTSQKIKLYDRCAFISILDPDNMEEKYDKTLDNFLQVRMYDIEADAYEKKDENGIGRISDAKNGTLVYQKPPDSELQKIVNFANKHTDKVLFVVHCSAGISRSGAVARYLFDKFMPDVDIAYYKSINKHTLPNLYIYKRLVNLDGSF